MFADVDPAHDTEMLTGGYLRNAIEALTALGRTADAEPLVVALEHNGVRSTGLGCLRWVHGVEATCWPHGANSMPPSRLRWRR